MSTSTPSTSHGAGTAATDSPAAIEAGIKANDDRAFEESLGAMWPFEAKNLLVKMAKKGDEGTTRTLLNAGRGNPNWITTLPREAFFLLGAVEIAVGMLISSLTESQIIAAVGTFGLLLLLYLWDGLVGFLPSTAVGSLLGFFVVLILVCFLINALSNNWKVTAGVLVAGAAVLIAFYLRDSSVFANLLPDVLGKFSLLSAFDSFSTDHVFDVPGILLYLSISALLVFLTVQVIQKRRWN